MFFCAYTHNMFFCAIAWNMLFLASERAKLGTLAPSSSIQSAGALAQRRAYGVLYYIICIILYTYYNCIYIIYYIFITVLYIMYIIYYIVAYYILDHIMKLRYANTWTPEGCSFVRTPRRCSFVRRPGICPLIRACEPSTGRLRHALRIGEMAQWRA